MSISLQLHLQLEHDPTVLSFESRDKKRWRGNVTTLPVQGNP